MRLVFDISGATAMSGGMRLHATEVVRAWADKFPHDELTVFGTEWATEEFKDLGERVRVWKWSNERVPLRFIGQIFVAPAVRRLRKADYLISLSPIVSPLTAERRGVCFQHDWRHIKNPEEFSRARKLYRRLWTLSASHALTNACISEKTRNETLTIVPGSRTLLVSNGGDHPARWDLTGDGSSDLDNCVVTFGHHNNKRPHLVIEGFAKFLQANPDSKERLAVLGARGSLQEKLQALAVRLGIESKVLFPGFVTDAQYQRVVSQARCIVLASSDEGYGLPIAEADYFGLPAIATSDSGLESIFSQLIVADPTPAGLEIALKEALLLDQDLGQKTLPSWGDSVSTLRNFLESVGNS